MSRRRAIHGGSAAVRLLALRVRFPRRAWMSVSFECCVSSGRDFCDGPIAVLKDSYRVWHLSVVSKPQQWECLTNPARSVDFHVFWDWVSYLILYKKVKWSRYRLGVAQRVGRGIALLFHERGTRRGEWSAARPGRILPPGKDPVPILQEAEWAPGPVLTSGKSRHHRDLTPNLPARSSVAIPTELPGPHLILYKYEI